MQGKRIAFVGASLTEGIYGGSYVNAVAEQMPEHTIINQGVGGSTMNRLLDRLPKVLAAEPDAAFILAGSNDAIAYSQPATRPYYKSQHGLPEGYVAPDDYLQLYRSLLEQLQLHHIQPLIGLPPLEYNPEVVEASQMYNRLAQEAARAYNLPVLDLSPLLLPEHIPSRPPLGLDSIFLIGDRVQRGWQDYDAEQQRGGYHYTFDGIHFTPATAQRVGKIIADWLRTHLD